MTSVVRSEIEIMVENFRSEIISTRVKCCIECGTTFLAAKDKRQMYCKRECADAADRKNKIRWNQEHPKIR